jgi:hypothetical protein
MTPAIQETSEIEKMENTEKINTKDKSEKKSKMENTDKKSKKGKLGKTPQAGNAQIVTKDPDDVNTLDGRKRMYAKMGRALKYAKPAVLARWQAAYSCFALYFHATSIFPVSAKVQDSNVH